MSSQSGSATLLTILTTWAVLVSSSPAHAQLCVDKALFEECNPYDEDPTTCWCGDIMVRNVDCDTGTWNPAQGCRLVPQYVCGASTNPSCASWCSNPAGPNCLGDTPCAETTCGGAGPPERCDGKGTDESVCAPDDDEPCSATRGEPVHVGSGAFFTHPKTDVQLTGAPVNIVFERSYTSLDGWPMPHEDITRIGRGWFHTFDERLFAANAVDDIDISAWPANVDVVHRGARGRGTTWNCTNSGTTYACTSVRDQNAVLTYDGTEWILDHNDGMLTKFETTGRLQRRENGHGFGWTVTYDSSGGTFDCLGARSSAAGAGACA